MPPAISFDPGETLRLISDPAEGINVFFGVPAIYQFMAQHPSFATADFSRLIIGGVGGAPMPVPLLKAWEARGVALQQGYGMTETSPAVLTLDKEDAARTAGSSGKRMIFCPSLTGDSPCLTPNAAKMAKTPSGLAPLAFNTSSKLSLCRI